MNEYERVKKLVQKKMKIKDISVECRQQSYVKARYMYFKLCQQLLRHNFKNVECSTVVNRKQEMVLYGIGEFDNLIDTSYYADISDLYSECVLELDLNTSENNNY